MTAPPKYPRIPHLVARPGMDPDDFVLSAAERDRLLRSEVVVEEKLDGANLAVWTQDGALQVATRGGVGAVDRGGHRGRARAWLLQRSDDVRDALGGDLALYGEWLLTQHQVRYDRLPAPFVGFDVLERASGHFRGVELRDDVLVRAGITLPPRLFTGVLGSIQAAERLIGASRFGSSQAEGVIVRAVEPAPGAPRVAKLIHHAWRPTDAAVLAAGGRQNRLIDQSAGW